MLTVYKEEVSKVNNKETKKKKKEKDLNRNFIEEDTWMPNKHMKICSSSLIIRKCKLKPQQDATTRLLEKPKLENLTIPSVGEDVEQLTFCARMARV